jgi:hypothetical protein
MLVLRAIVAVFGAFFATKADLVIENLALRQQLIYGWDGLFGKDKGQNPLRIPSAPSQ